MYNLGNHDCDKPLPETFLKQPNRYSLGIIAFVHELNLYSRTQLLINKIRKIDKCASNPSESFLFASVVACNIIMKVESHDIVRHQACLSIHEVIEQYKHALTLYRRGHHPAR